MNREPIHLSDIHHPASIYKQQHIIDPLLHILCQRSQTALPVLILYLEEVTKKSH